MMRAAIVCLVSLAIASSLPAQTQPPITLPPALDRVLRDYERAWQAKDAAGLAALFTDDGFVLSSGKPPVRGRDAIKTAYSGAGGPLLLTPIAYATDGNIGYIIGLYGRSKETPDEGKFNLALRRVKGKWLIAADMDNSNQMRRPSQ
jgi:ketosteroid isomerase-like protein